MPTITRRAILLQAAAMTGPLPLTTSAQERLPAVAKLIVGFPPGGAVDAVSRRVADALRGIVADTVIVDNRQGAGGRIAINGIRNAPTDGSQWLVTPGSMVVIYPHVYRNLSYHPVHDLLPVVQIANVPLTLVVGPGVPSSVVDVKSYLAWVRSNPAHANIGTPAAGNITDFLAFLLARSAGLQLQQIAYKGGAPAVQDLLGGQIPALINQLTEVLPHLASGKLRVLAVTSQQRISFLPDVPTFAEQGHPTVIGSEWIGLFARPGTAQRQVERMATGMRAALQTPAVREALDKLALEPAGDDGAALGRRVQAEMVRWAEVSKAFGFRIEE